MAEVVAHKGLLKTVKVHVEDTGGSGRPVVLIHGWPLSGADWSNQVSALQSVGLRVITYDRRGFGQSDKPATGYTYDTLAEDLNSLITELDLNDVSLVGFSMGGGEVARYIAKYGEEKLHSVVFASSVTPYLMNTSDNPDGPLSKELAAQMTAGLTTNRDGFFDDFSKQFFTAGDKMLASEEQRQTWLELAGESSQVAALACMASFSATDFRDDITQITVPTLVIHGDADGVVPFEGSGKRTHATITQSELVVLEGAPHGCNVTHAEDFNSAILDFLGK